MHSRTKSHQSNSQPTSSTKKTLKLSTQKQEEKNFAANLIKIKQVFNDRVNKHLQTEVLECDIVHAKNPQRVPEYTKDIL